MAVLFALAAVATACTSDDDAAGSEDASPADESSSQASSSEQASQASPTPVGGTFTIDHFNDGVYCDGNEAPAVVLFDAEPGETISFSSPMPVEIPDGIADDRGTYQLPWKCEPNESSLSWQITATGATSGRTSTFFVEGSFTDPAGARLMTYTPSPEPLVCDGTRQVVGQLENAEPFEIVDFRTPTADRLRSGTADSQGNVQVNWTCDQLLSSTTWEVRAHGQKSLRVAAFTVTGLPPQPLNDGPIEVELLEDPFVCNRERRKVARLTNLTPDVVVRFNAGAGNGDMLSGQADSMGTLDVFWQCQRNESGTSWTLVAEEFNVHADDDEVRSAKISFDGIASGAALTIAVDEEPFACDGETRPFAVLSNFVSREFVDFTSPQATGLRQGQADRDGNLPVRWQCDADQVGTVWEVTATGATSGLELTFTITGAGP